MPPSQADARSPIPSTDISLPYVSPSLDGGFSPSPRGSPSREIDSASTPDNVSADPCDSDDRFDSDDFSDDGVLRMDDAVSPAIAERKEDENAVAYSTTPTSTRHYKPAAIKSTAPNFRSSTFATFQPTSPNSLYPETTTIEPITPTSRRSDDDASTRSLRVDDVDLTQASPPQYDVDLTQASPTQYDVDLTQASPTQYDIDLTQASPTQYDIDLTQASPTQYDVFNGGDSDCDGVLRMSDSPPLVDASPSGVAPPTIRLRVGGGEISSESESPILSSQAKRSSSGRILHRRLRGINTSSRAVDDRASTSYFDPPTFTQEDPERSPSINTKVLFYEI